MLPFRGTATGRPLLARHSGRAFDLTSGALGSFRKTPAPLNSVAAGEEWLGTHVGKPCVRFAPASQAFLGGLRRGVPGSVPPVPIPASEWNGAVWMLA